MPLHGKGPEPVRSLRLHNPAVIHMEGTWHFETTRGEIVNGHFVPKNPHSLGATEDFVAPTYNDNAWHQIPVPANWEVEGFSKPTYNEPDDAVGLYRRSVDIPSSFAGKHITWHFDGVFAGAEVWVNGHPVGYHESGYGAFDLDVTKAILPGQTNTVALRVSKKVPSSTLDSGDYWALGGIYRETYLLATPELHVDDVLIRTDLDEKYTNSHLTAAVKLSGEPGRQFALVGQLYDIAGHPVSSQNLAGSGTFGENGSVSVNFSQDVLAPKLWSAEKPNLYYLVLHLTSEGKSIESVEERFGFKKVEIKKGVVLWNGVPVKLTGTCRHEEWSKIGHALTEHEWQTDVAMIKAANINAVRTSHYNHAQRFLEICEEKGIYLLDESAGCWADMSDPKLTPWMVLHAQETFARDKNRPCVLAWSIGNESGFGPVNHAAFLWMKQADPTRPSFISWTSTWADKTIDFDDRHYPALDDLRARAYNDERKTTPLLLSEQPHTYFGNEAKDYDPGFHEAWIYTLRNNWDVIWKAPGVPGSFIWEWQDQGLLDRFPNNDGRDPKTGLRDNNEKGIVSGFREPKGELYDVKMVYSPIVVEGKTITPIAGKAHLSFTNRYSFTDLSELTCKWQQFSAGRIIASGTRRIALAPRTCGIQEFELAPAAQALRLEFIHPDGRSVYSTRLTVRGADLLPHPKPSITTGPMVITDGTKIQISQGSAQILINKQTGLIESWKQGDKVLASSGPVLNLGERRDPNGPIKAEHYLTSKAWPTLKNVTYNVGSKSVTVSGDVVLPESPQILGVFTYTLTPTEAGQINLHWKLDWSSENKNAWELGVRFALPVDAKKLTWSRDTPWTEYPKGHPGSPQGSASVTDVAFRSTKRDIRWMTIQEAGGLSLQAVSNGFPLHMRARPENGGVTWFASIGIEPPPDYNESTPELKIHLVKGKTYEGGLSLSVVKS